MCREAVEHHLAGLECSYLGRYGAFKQDTCRSTYPPVPFGVGAYGEFSAVIKINPYVKSKISGFIGLVSISLQQFLVLGNKCSVYAHALKRFLARRTHYPTVKRETLFKSVFLLE